MMHPCVVSVAPAADLASASPPRPPSPPPAGNPSTTVTPSRCKTTLHETVGGNPHMVSPAVTWWRFARPTLPRAKWPGDTRHEWHILPSLRRGGGGASEPLGDQPSSQAKPVVARVGTADTGIADTTPLRNDSKSCEPNQAQESSSEHESVTVRQCSKAGALTGG